VVIVQSYRLTSFLIAAPIQVFEQLGFLLQPQGGCSINGLSGDG